MVGVEGGEGGGLAGQPGLEHAWQWRCTTGQEVSEWRADLLCGPTIEHCS
jgi:hypothetical protein